MTGNKCLLDTYIIIEAFRNGNTIGGRLDEIEEVYVPIVVVGELYYGAYRSLNAAKHISQVRFFLLNCRLLPSDNNTADIYGSIKAALVKKGKPIPENDIWIAALARQYNLPIFTSDNHFSEIEHIVCFK